MVTTEWTDKGVFPEISNRAVRTPILTPFRRTVNMHKFCSRRGTTSRSIQPNLRNLNWRLVPFMRFIAPFPYIFNCYWGGKRRMYSLHWKSSLSYSASIPLSTIARTIRACRPGATSHIYTGTPSEFGGSDEQSIRISSAELYPMWARQLHAKSPMDMCSWVLLWCDRSSKLTDHRVRKQRTRLKNQCESSFRRMQMSSADYRALSTT